MTKYVTQGLPDCADCEFLAHDTDGEVLCCPECDEEIRVSQEHLREEYEAERRAELINEHALHGGRDYWNVQ